MRVEYSRDWNAADGEWTHPARLLLSKLHVCVSQLEQFPVKVHDLAGASGAAGGLVNFGGGAASGLAMMGGGGGPLGLIGHLSGMGGGPSSLRGLSALRFLHSQQIKVSSFAALVWSISNFISVPFATSFRRKTIETMAAWSY